MYNAEKSDMPHGHERHLKQNHCLYRFTLQNSITQAKIQNLSVKRLVFLHDILQYTANSVEQSAADSAPPRMLERTSKRDRNSTSRKL